MQFRFNVVCRVVCLGWKSFDAMWCDVMWYVILFFFWRGGIIYVGYWIEMWLVSWEWRIEGWGLVSWELEICEKFLGFLGEGGIESRHSYILFLFPLSSFYGCPRNPIKLHHIQYSLTSHCHPLPRALLSLLTTSRPHGLTFVKCCYSRWIGELYK